MLERNVQSFSGSAVNKNQDFPQSLNQQPSSNQSPSWKSSRNSLIQNQNSSQSSFGQNWNKGDNNQNRNTFSQNQSLYGQRHGMHRPYSNGQYINCQNSRGSQSSDFTRRPMECLQCGNNHPVRMCPEVDWQAMDKMTCDFCHKTGHSENICVLSFMNYQKSVKD